MKTSTLKTFLFVFLVFLITNANAQQILHYWNFNNNSSITNLLTPSSSYIAGASITHIAGGTSAIDLNGTGQNFNVNNYNAQNGDASGTHLRFNNPIGGEIEFKLPSTGYENIIIKFTTRRSSQGAGNQLWQYSTDGINYTIFDTINPIDGNPVLQTLDFTGITLANNNPNFKIKVSFEKGSGGTSGNNRFDNLTSEGTSLGGGDNIAPVASFYPINNATNIAISVNPLISFNENVRLLNNDSITGLNAASIVELRLNDVNGSLIPFTATFSTNTITIIPSQSLLNNQKYYVSLKENTVEDFSNNAITTVQSSVFTTIPVQTQFNAGDLVFVSYRMNSTSTEDEIALLTLVDIIPGTFIYLTDAKYTTNAQAQCTGGIVWTSPLNECIPAGAVIRIQTSALVTNKGSVTGNGFGLSSGGDQIIVYTGSATNPVYITALSSNAWVTNNTSCSGSLSMIPQGLTDQVNAISLSTAPGNVSGNSANGYYNGTQTGNASQLRNEILNPNNWIITNSGAAQQWPIYSFPGSPTVLSIKPISSTSIQVVFNSNLDNTTATNINNFSGIANLTNISITNNGSLNDTLILNYSSPFVSSNTYTLTISNISNTNNLVMICPYSYTFIYNSKVAVANNFVVVNENQGNYELVFNITNPSNCSIFLEVLSSPFSTANINDITLSSQTLQFTGSQSQYILNIPIIDDNTKEQMAEYLVIAMRNPMGCSIDGDSMITFYIKDNDRSAPVATNDLELNHIGSFDPSGANNSTCEVVVYDSVSKRLFSTSAISAYLDIIDFSNPDSLNVIQSVNMNLYGGITSVAVKNGIVAVASPNANEQLNGSVVFFDINGNFIKQLEVGALPDMITFTPDGLKVMTANEGQPNDSYTVDPEGTISIININAGIANLTQNDVTTLNFTQFNSQEISLTGSGVRKTKSSSTLSQDIEPEYITISDDSKKAWVTLQENNAIAEINLLNNTITDIWALGTKNFASTFSGIDASDNNNNILIANWPVNAYYIPDAVANFSLNNTNYLITANEGDEKEYAGLNERTTVGNANYVLDSIVFPNAQMLKKSYNLGRLRVSNLNGDIDNDGDFDVINCLGSRSFSIWNADSKSLVYDNGDDFEMITASNPLSTSIFNSDNTENALKGRSRSKGPEPEGITLADISNKKYAFIALERIGGVMVYDISNPASPIFVDYKNSRSTTQYSGDHGPETLIFIPENKSPNGKAYLIVANEISGTLSIFEVTNNNPSTITFYTDGGTHSNPATFTTANLPLTLTDASKTGFTFAGWFDNDSLTGSAITQITTTGNKTLWAKFNLIAPVATTRIWTGTANSTWTETTNWANGLPASIDNVIIPAIAANFPVISTPVTINNLTIESGAQLIQNSILNISAKVKVKQNISSGQWHFISSPVNNATAYAFSNANPLNAGQTIYLQKYYEAWINTPGTSPWTDVTNGPAEIMSAGKGYEVWSDNNHTITMEGTQLNSADVVAPVTFTGAASYPGYNLIGNSYPSAINILGFQTWGSNMDASMWLWNGANYIFSNGVIGDFTTVASNQAFMVKANAVGAMFTIPSTAKTFGGSFLKSTVADVLKLKVSGNGYNDAAFINFNSNATANYDGQFDVEKIFGIDAAPQFYSTITNKNLSINTLPSLTSPVVVPMALNVGVNATYTITASEMSSFANGTTINLEDTKTGTFTNLMQQAVYTFTASPADNANRFKVHLGVNGINENGNGNISIYSNSNVIYVNNSSNEVVKEIVVMNVLGQEILNKKAANTTVNTITMDVASAYYVVKVVTENKVYTEKVYVR